MLIMQISWNLKCRPLFPSKEKKRFVCQMSPGMKQHFLKITHEIWKVSLQEPAFMWLFTNLLGVSAISFQATTAIYPSLNGRMQPVYQYNFFSMLWLMSQITFSFSKTSANQGKTMEIRRKKRLCLVRKRPDQWDNLVSWPINQISSSEVWHLWHLMITSKNKKNPSI